MRLKRKRQMGAHRAISLEGPHDGHGAHRGGRFAGAAETPMALKQNIGISKSISAAATICNANKVGERVKLGAGQGTAERAS